MMMRALVSFQRNGQTVAVGERFDVERPIEAAALQYQRKAAFVSAASRSSTPRKRTYRRRDLQAE